MKAVLLFMGIVLATSDSLSFAWFIGTKITAAVIFIYLLFQVKEI